MPDLSNFFGLGAAQCRFHRIKILLGNSSFSSLMIFKTVYKPLESVNNSDHYRREKEIFGLFEDGDLASRMLWRPLGDTPQDIGGLVAPFVQVCQCVCLAQGDRWARRGQEPNRGWCHAISVGGLVTLRSIIKNPDISWCSGRIQKRFATRTSKSIMILLKRRGMDHPSVSGMRYNMSQAPKQACVV